MTDLLQINLEDLTRRYLCKADTAKARDLLDKFYQGKRLVVRVDGKAVEVKLKNLLRHHEQEGVADWETRLRDSFDQLLIAYGTMEMACLVGMIPEPLPPEFASAALLRLSHPSVRRYYEVHYTSLLPQLFRQRLRGINTAHDNQDETSTVLFMKFLDLHDHVETDPQLETFLWFLDGGIRDDLGLEDLLDVLKDESAFFHAMTGRPTGAAHLTRGLLGMQKFFLFSREIEQLLTQAKDFPLLQSAIWFIYEYWFGHLKQRVGGKLAKAIVRMAAWSAVGADPESEPPALPAKPHGNNDLWKLPNTWPAESGQSPAEYDQGSVQVNWEKCPTSGQISDTLKRLTGNEFRRPLEQIADACKESGS